MHEIVTLLNCTYNIHRSIYKYHFRAFALKLSVCGWCSCCSKHWSAYGNVQPDLSCHSALLWCSFSKMQKLWKQSVRCHRLRSSCSSLLKILKFIIPSGQLWQQLSARFWALIMTMKKLMNLVILTSLIMLDKITLVIMLTSDQ